MIEFFYYKEIIVLDLFDEEFVDFFYSYLESENYLGVLIVI